MPANHNSWVEHIYQYAEYYYWEPQQLNKLTVHDKGGLAGYEEVRKGMRRTEVPLNIIFNITVRLLPTRILNKLFRCFLPGTSTFFGQEFALVDPKSLIGSSAEFMLPDMALESDIARIFIELKVGARISIEQTYKYLFQHAIWNHTIRNDKMPYLFYLSPQPLIAQWEPRERTLVFVQSHSPAALLNYLKMQPFPAKLAGMSVEYLRDEASRILAKLEIGATTWSAIGDCLREERANLQKSGLTDGDETLGKLLDDFLYELKSRGY